MPMVSVPVAMSSTSKHTTMALWGILQDWLIKEDKTTSVSFTAGSVLSVTF